MVGFIAVCVMLLPIVLMVWFGFQSRGSRSSAEYASLQERHSMEPGYTPAAGFEGFFDGGFGSGDAGGGDSDGGSSS